MILFYYGWHGHRHYLIFRRYYFEMLLLPINRARRRWYMIIDILIMPFREFSMRYEREMIISRRRECLFRADYAARFIIILRNRSDVLRCQSERAICDDMPRPLCCWCLRYARARWWRWLLKSDGDVTRARECRWCARCFNQDSAMRRHYYKRAAICATMMPRRCCLRHAIEPEAKICHYYDERMMLLMRCHWYATLLSPCLLFRHMMRTIWGHFLHYWWLLLSFLSPSLSFSLHYYLFFFIDISSFHHYAFSSLPDDDDDILMRFEMMPWYYLFCCRCWCWCCHYTLIRWLLITIIDHFHIYLLIWLLLRLFIFIRRHLMTLMPRHAAIHYFFIHLLLKIILRHLRRYMMILLLPSAMIITRLFFLFTISLRQTHMPNQNTCDMTERVITRALRSRRRLLPLKRARDDDDELMSGIMRYDYDER